MKGVDQLVNSGQTVLFRDVGQVGITCGGYRAGMTKNGLDMTET